MQLSEINYAYYMCATFNMQLYNKLEIILKLNLKYLFTYNTPKNSNLYYKKSHHQIRLLV